MEFRKIFDTYPELFDRYRPRYSPELFAELIDFADIREGKTVLEIGPGTGQATEPVLKTGCDYHAIELGENLCAVMEKKFGSYQNFHIVNDDFISYDFKDMKFDMIYSATAIQWIPENIAYSKTFHLLKPGGTLAMMYTYGDYKTPNPELYGKIQEVYSKYFRPDVPYVHGNFRYENSVSYGFTNTETRKYSGIRELTAQEYVNYCKTHCDHNTIPEPYNSKFFEGLRKTVEDSGNKLVFYDTYILHLAKKPL